MEEELVPVGPPTGDEEQELAGPPTELVLVGPPMREQESIGTPAELVLVGPPTGHEEQE